MTVFNKSVMMTRFKVTVICKCGRTINIEIDGGEPVFICSDCGSEYCVAVFDMDSMLSEIYDKNKMGCGLC